MKNAKFYGLITLLFLSLSFSYVGCGGGGGGGDDSSEPTPPIATITSSTGGSTYNEGDNISFSCTGSDTEDGTLTGGSLIWTSNIDGQIGTGTAFSTTSLSPGTHIITIEAIDSDGLTGTDSITIIILDIVNIEYEISINDPSNHELFVKLFVYDINQNTLSVGRQRMDKETVSIISEISVKDEANNPIGYHLYEVTPGDPEDIEKITVDTGERGKIIIEYKVDLTYSTDSPQWILFEDYGAVETQILYYQPFDTTAAGEVKVRFLLPDGWRAITRFENSGEVYRMIEIDDIVNHRGLNFFFWGPIIFGNLDVYEKLIGNVNAQVAFYGRQDIQQPIANTVFSIIEYGQNAIGDLTTVQNLNLLYTFLIEEPEESRLPPGSRDHILGDFRSFNDGYQDRYREYAHVIFHTFFSHEELELWDIVHTTLEEGIIQFFALKSLEKTAAWEANNVQEELTNWYNDYSNYILGTQYDVPIEPESNWVGFPNDPLDSAYSYGIQNIISYEKIPLVFWLLNEKIKDVTGEQKSLIEVWKYFHDNDPGTTEAPTTYNEILIACNSISGHDFTTFFDYYVTGNNELPYYVENNMLLIDDSMLPSIPPLN